MILDRLHDFKQYLEKIYTASKIKITRSLRDEMLETYAQTAPKAMAVMRLPIKYRKRIRTSNSIERLNQEISCRERVVRIFLNEVSLLRLIGALLIE